MKPLALICAAITAFSPAGLQPVTTPEPQVQAPTTAQANASFSVPIDKPARTNSVFTIDELIVNLEALDPNVFPMFRGHHRFNAGSNLGLDILQSKHGGQILLLTPGPKKSRDENKRALEKRFLETGTLPPIPGDGEPLTETVALYSGDYVIFAGKPEAKGMWTVDGRSFGFSKRAPIHPQPKAPWPSGVPVNGSSLTMEVEETQNCDCCGSPKPTTVRKTWIRVHGHWFEVKR